MPADIKPPTSEQLTIANDAHPSQDLNADAEMQSPSPKVKQEPETGPETEASAIPNVADSDPFSNMAISCVSFPFV